MARTMDMPLSYMDFDHLPSLVTLDSDTFDYDSVMPNDFFDIYVDVQSEEVSLCEQADIFPVLPESIQVSAEITIGQFEQGIPFSRFDNIASQSDETESKKSRKRKRKKEKKNKHHKKRKCWHAKLEAKKPRKLNPDEFHLGPRVPSQPEADKFLQPVIFPCNFCRRHYFTFDLYLKHARNHTHALRTCAGSKQGCDERFKTTYEMRRHERKCKKAKEAWRSRMLVA